MKHDGVSTGLFQDEEDGYNLEETTLEEANDDTTHPTCEHCQGGGKDLNGGGICQTCGGIGSHSEKKKNLEEETKYKLKLPNSSPEPSGDDFDLGGEDEELDLGGEDEDFDLGDEGGEEPSSDKPFDDEPFDADVEASEEDDPEKYIQQLAGKLGQTMRTYAEDRGEPDFDLEKFAINSVISASHSAEMDEGDQDDIISKVKESGMDDGESEEPMGDEDLGGELENDVEPELDLGGEDEELDLGGEDEELEESGEPRFNDPEYVKTYDEMEREDRLGDEGSEYLDSVTMKPEVAYNSIPDTSDEIDALEDVGFYDDNLEDLVKLKGGGSYQNDMHEGLSDDEVEEYALFAKTIEEFKEITDGKVLYWTYAWMAYHLKRDRHKGILERIYKRRKKELNDTTDYPTLPTMGDISDSFNMSENNSIFVKNKLKEMTEPEVAPAEPTVKPEREERKTRKGKTWKKTSPDPTPKFGDEEGCGEKELIMGDEE